MAVFTVRDLRKPPAAQIRRGAVVESVGRISGGGWYSYFLVDFL